MGMDLDKLLGYFHTPKATFWDYLVIIILLLLILWTIFLAVREWILEDKLNKVVKHRLNEKLYRDRSRRETPRLAIKIPITATLMDAVSIYNGEILNISSGGIRFVLFEFTAPKVPVDQMIITSTVQPLSSFGNTKIEIVSFAEGPRSNATLFHARWQDLNPNIARSLNREIRRRLIRTV
jgi:PilZ domain